MQTIRLHIKTSATDIPIYIGKNLWSNLRAFLGQHFSAHSIFVISDSNVSQLYGERIFFELGTLSTFKGNIAFPAGEQNKSRRQKEELENQLLKNRAGRDSVIIALGGGVTGDLAGFVAATYYRGIPFIHLPTSLMAQVDSSIGGKVGINHPAGKNLIGAFYQPQAVFADLEFLRTLPEEEFLNGMAEVIKYAVTLDDDLWHLIENEEEKIMSGNSKILETMINRCIQLKIGVVEQDEKESGYRSILNFGHTVGHAIEKLSDLKIKHGHAISAGMKIAVRLSQQLLGFPETKAERLNGTLRRYHLNSISLNDFHIGQIWEAMLSDKKTRRQTPRFTLLKDTGQPGLYYEVRKEDFENAFRTQS